MSRIEYERMTIIEMAKISSKGQITIPVSVRNKLKLKAGDKIIIFEENGRFYLENSAMMAFKREREIRLRVMLTTAILENMDDPMDFIWDKFSQDCVIGTVRHLLIKHFDLSEEKRRLRLTSTLKLWKDIVHKHKSVLLNIVSCYNGFIRT